MEYIIPHYFDRFRCVAAECEDTCCAGWAIMIDEDTLEKYTGFNENNFYFNDNGIVIYFQSYEIAPYASGSPEFNISYSFLRNYLKKDFIP